MHSPSKVLAIGLIAFALLASCSKDPCDAATDWLRFCAGKGGLYFAGFDEAAVRAQCPKAFSSCNDDQKSELAGMYECLEGDNFCYQEAPNDESLPRCMQTISYGSLYCLQHPQKSCEPIPCVYDSSEATCQATAGCSWQVACSSMATDFCPVFTRQAECASNASHGCSWTGTACAGPSTSPCTSISDKAVCVSTEGCWVKQACKGAPAYTCSGADEASCESDPRCRWH